MAPIRALPRTSSAESTTKHAGTAWPSSGAVSSTKSAYPGPAAVRLAYNTRSSGIQNAAARASYPLRPPGPPRVGDGRAAADRSVHASPHSSVQPAGGVDIAPVRVPPEHLRARLQRSYRPAGRAVGFAGLAIVERTGSLSRDVPHNGAGGPPLLPAYIRDGALLPEHRLSIYPSYLARYGPISPGRPPASHSRGQLI